MIDIFISNGLDFNADCPGDDLCGDYSFCSNIVIPRDNWNLVKYGSNNAISCLFDGKKLRQNGKLVILKDNIEDCLTNLINRIIKEVNKSNLERQATQEIIPATAFAKINVFIHFGGISDYVGNEITLQQYIEKIKNTIRDENTDINIDELNVFCWGSLDEVYKEYVTGDKSLPEPDTENHREKIKQLIARRTKSFEEKITNKIKIPLITLDVLLQAWLFVKVWQKQNPQLQKILAPDAANKLHPLFPEVGNGNFWFSEFIKSVKMHNGTLKDFMTLIKPCPNLLAFCNKFEDDHSKKEYDYDALLGRAHDEIGTLLKKN